MRTKVCLPRLNVPGGCVRGLVAWAVEVAVAGRRDGAHARRVRVVGRQRVRLRARARAEARAVRRAVESLGSRTRSEPLTAGVADAPFVSPARAESPAHPRSRVRRRELREQHVPDTTPRLFGARAVGYHGEDRVV